MVRTTPGVQARRRSPEYALERVRDLASRRAVWYGGSRVQRDVENLGYTPDDVCNCLQLLNDCHFRGAVRYGPSGGWLDEYKISYPGPGGVIDELYVKLKLHRDAIVVILASFHRDR